jgi:hypothetical protein
VIEGDVGGDLIEVVEGKGDAIDSIGGSENSRGGLGDLVDFAI